MYTIQYLSNTPALFLLGLLFPVPPSAALLHQLQLVRVKVELGYKSVQCRLKQNREIGTMLDSNKIKQTTYSYQIWQSNL